MRPTHSKGHTSMRVRRAPRLYLGAEGLEAQQERKLGNKVEEESVPVSGFRVYVKGNPFGPQMPGKKNPE